ncbi:MAG: glycoside hydrolase family 65 protein [Defluviitaleaceae bacterium]|nr:glycoside hydrolase family 65 protein [Defluviitaleaceae bacterium]MCL2238884.1 glycoside hydrolase family 65 protein [Defluviitaleaceae bacterium]
MENISGSGWILQENSFNPAALGKCEAIMCGGNGYMGLRAATEERYIGERRGLFVAGTFNRFLSDTEKDNEVSELPNAADFLEMEIKLDGQLFSLAQGTVKEYIRSLHFATGELKRQMHWVSPAGKEYRLDFHRVVSLGDLHTVAQKVCIQPLSGVAEITLSTGINAQMTNSGAQHFAEGPKRFYDRRYMQLVQTTTQSGIDFVLTTDVTLSREANTRIAMDRRRIFSVYDISLEPEEVLTIEKITTVHTSRDKKTEGLDTAALQAHALAHLKAQSALGYGEIARQSAEAWHQKVWGNIPVTLESTDPTDLLALRFAQYHLQIMAPAHDNRMNIGAKGLSGEGYKGHTFWDTEIFVLPYYIFTQPETALSLEEYRYLSLPGARKKAEGNGFSGAQFPWESAWLDDGEVTPLYGAADIVTGLPTPILTGLIEIHITCDVCYGVWQYYTATGDADFMARCGYELVFETANFWVSRLEPGPEGKLHINNVIGPDEYKDQIDDDAFTNHFARWNLWLAMAYRDALARENPALLEKLRPYVRYGAWEEKARDIYIPEPREDGIIPQNRTFLTLKEIDLTKYKNQTQVGSIYRDYNHEQIGEMQVIKQADVLLLILLKEEHFTPEVKRANWDYYEPRTLHDSSLSLSTHCILAADMGDEVLAYDLFKRACNIDMGPNMKSSDDGIHAGSIGGIWQCAVLGFGGLRLVGDKIRLAPALPKAWTRLQFYCWLKGQKIKINITHDTVQVENLTRTAPVEMEINGTTHVVADMLEIK